MLTDPKFNDAIKNNFHYHYRTEVTEVDKSVMVGEHVQPTPPKEQRSKSVKYERFKEVQPPYSKTPNKFSALSSPAHNHVRNYSLVDYPESNKPKARNMLDNLYGQIQKQVTDRMTKQNSIQRYIGAINVINTLD